MYYQNIDSFNLIANFQQPTTNNQQPKPNTFYFILNSNCEIFYIFSKISIQLGFISFLEEHMLSCQWKKAGVECMGCGMQRAIIHILKGEFVEAFYIYPAIYTMGIMMIFLGLHLRFNFIKGHLVLRWLFIINILIIIGNYISKYI